MLHMASWNAQEQKINAFGPQYELNLPFLFYYVFFLGFLGTFYIENA